MRARSWSTSPLGLGLSLALALPEPLALAASPEPVEAPAPAPEPQPQPQPAVAAQPAPPPPPAAAVEVDPRHYAMVLSGDIIIGLGGATLLTSLVGLGIRSDARSQRAGLVAAGADADALARQDQRVQTGTYLAIGGGAATLALFATGITLVALGYARERKRRLELPQAALGRHGASLNWTLHF